LQHGYFTHGGPFLYEQVLHVPLIVKKPGKNERKTVDALVERIEVPATILDFAAGTGIIHIREFMQRERN
jgi:arylsulfatase A-like enzyme